MKARMAVFLILLAVLGGVGFTVWNGRADARNDSSQETASPAGSPFSIAVVDVQALLSESKAAKALQEQIKSERDKFQAEFSKYEKDLREIEQDLIKKRASLKPEEFNKKREAFESKLLETRKLAQSRKRALDEGFSSAVGVLRDEMVKIVAQVAESKKYDLVISRQNVVIVDKTLDITADVLAQLDQNMPSVALKVETAKK